MYFGGAQFLYIWNVLNLNTYSSLTIPGKTLEYLVKNKARIFNKERKSYLEVLVGALVLPDFPALKKECHSLDCTTLRPSVVPLVSR